MHEQQIIEIEWEVPSSHMPTHYASHLVVQGTEQQTFVLSFYELRYPVLVGTPDEVKSAASRIRHVPAVCVARVAVEASELPKMIQALQETWLKCQQWLKTSTMPAVVPTGVFPIMPGMR